MASALRPVSLRHAGPQTREAQTPACHRRNQARHSLAEHPLARVLGSLITTLHFSRTTGLRAANLRLACRRSDAPPSFRAYRPRDQEPRPQSRSRFLRAAASRWLVEPGLRLRGKLGAFAPAEIVVPHRWRSSPLIRRGAWKEGGKGNRFFPPSRSELSRRAVLRRDRRKQQPHIAAS